jgi:hypothetical protein
MFYVDMDIHKNPAVCGTVTNERGDLVERPRVNYRYREEVTGYFNQSRQGGTQVVMEVACGWGWLCRYQIQIRMNASHHTLLGHKKKIGHISRRRYLR